MGASRRQGPRLPCFLLPSADPLDAFLLVFDRLVEQGLYHIRCHWRRSVALQLLSVAQWRRVLAQLLQENVVRGATLQLVICLIERGWGLVTGLHQCCWRVQTLHEFLGPICLQRLVAPYAAHLRVLLVDRLLTRSEDTPFCGVDRLLEGGL